MNLTANLEGGSGRVNQLSASQEQTVNATQRLGARYAIYKMLSLAYLYPGDIDWATFSHELPGTLAEAAEVLALDISAETADLATLSLPDFQQMCCEHTMLFINNPTTNPISPYESMYREETIMGRCARLVREHYERYGLAVDPRHSYLLPDHIALELDFMAWLIEKEMDGKPSSSVEQASFFSTHLEKWMPQFLADVKGAAAHLYFTALARVADEFFQYEKGLLGGEQSCVPGGCIA